MTTTATELTVFIKEQSLRHAWFLTVGANWDVLENRFGLSRTMTELNLCGFTELLRLE